MEEEEVIGRERRSKARGRFYEKSDRILGTARSDIFPGPGERGGKY